ncbi:unnamed protein product [Gordionus sp. m RMFG-2023]|uniref:plastin-1-like n=1 Tax=Gordionus sp. m RMFG-2023 TaxID=3053472 RepID=UPI0030E252A0
MGDFKKEYIRLNHEQKEELSHVLKTVDSKGTGYISLKDLGDAFNAVGIKIPPYEVRKMASDWERKNSKIPDGKLQFSEFEKLYRDLKSKEFATTFKSMVSKKDNLVTHGGMSETSSEGTTHTVKQEEQVAFSHWINTNLGGDKDLNHLLPIEQEGMDLYDKVKDGILLCKILNFSCPDTIDERALNKKNLNVYTMHENLVLAINSSLAIGCNVVNIGADDLTKGKPHLVLGLLWQIIRIGLFNQVDLQHCPGLINLLRDGEKLEDMMKLSTEAILLRWVNYHLANAGYEKQISNFTTDIMDSIPYIYLIHQIAPKDKSVSLLALRESDLERRAELMLKEADKIKCRAFVSPRDVVNGNYKLNVAFVANMFNSHPALSVAEKDLTSLELQEDVNAIEETREERTYRNWMNSMGVSPHVYWLYSDLCDGLVILQLYDIIKPGIVEWSKVHKRFSKLKAFMEKIENCNYAVFLGKKIRFSLVGIAGQDINDGNTTLTLALVWQLMRAYTLSLLCNLTSNNHSGTPKIEREIIDWVNNKLKSNNKTSKINSFQDSSISNGKVIIDLIDSIKRGSIDYSQVKDGTSDEAKLENAKYAISMSRKLGAKIYALPDDIVEVNPKMVMTVFACLMGRDFNNIQASHLGNIGNTIHCNGASNDCESKQDEKCVKINVSTYSSPRLSPTSSPLKEYNPPFIPKVVEKGKSPSPARFSPTSFSNSHSNSPPNCNVTNRNVVSNFNSRLAGPGLQNLHRVVYSSSSNHSSPIASPVSPQPPLASFSQNNITNNATTNFSNLGSSTNSYTRDTKTPTPTSSSDHLSPRDSPASIVHGRDKTYESPLNDSFDQNNEIEMPKDNKSEDVKVSQLEIQNIYHETFNSEIDDVSENNEPGDVKDDFNLRLEGVKYSSPLKKSPILNSVINGDTMASSTVAKESKDLSSWIGKNGSNSYEGDSFEEGSEEEINPNPGAACNGHIKSPNGLITNKSFC